MRETLLFLFFELWGYRLIHDKRDSLLVQHIIAALQQNYILDMDTASSMLKSWMSSSSFHLNDNNLIRNFLHISDVMLVFCLTNIHFVARFSSWWVVILWSLRWDRLPTWFLIPVHVIIYVARSLFSHTTPYTNIPLHAIPESLFPYLNID